MSAEIVFCRYWSDPDNSEVFCYWNEYQGYITLFRKSRYVGSEKRYRKGNWRKKDWSDIQSPLAGKRFQDRDPSAVVARLAQAVVDGFIFPPETIDAVIRSQCITDDPEFARWANDPERLARTRAVAARLHQREMEGEA